MTATKTVMPSCWKTIPVSGCEEASCHVRSCLMEEAMLQGIGGGLWLTSSKKLRHLVARSARSCGQQPHGLTHGPFPLASCWRDLQAQPTPALQLPSNIPKQRTKPGHAWTPDPQKMWENEQVLFQASKVVINNQYNRQVEVFFKNTTLVGYL